MNKVSKLFLALWLVVGADTVFAFTPAETLALKNAALAEPSIATCISTADDQCVANWFNSASTFVVWKTQLDEFVVLEDSGFNYTLWDGLSVGKRDEWHLLFKRGFCNPSKSNIRAAFADIWTGTAAKLLVQDAILALSKRNATQAEKTLATGTGTTVSPGTMTFEGELSPGDVSHIVR